MDLDEHCAAIDFDPEGRGACGQLRLYRREGPYWYVGGYNPLALIALAAGILPCLPGFAAAAGLVHVSAVWSRLYDYAWFVSFGMALLTYVVLMKSFGPVAGDTSGSK